MIGAPASLEEQIAKVVCEAAVVILEDLLRQLRLPQPTYTISKYTSKQVIDT